jgi:hypothetical protein
MFYENQTEIFIFSLVKKASMVRKREKEDLEVKLDVPDACGISKNVKGLEKDVKKDKKFLFHRIHHLKKHHQALFSLIIVVGVVFVWRGVWNLVDRYWFPESMHPTVSDISGILVGIIILLLCHKIVNQLAGESDER